MKSPGFPKKPGTESLPLNPRPPVGTECLPYQEDKHNPEHRRNEPEYIFKLCIRRRPSWRNDNLRADHPDGNRPGNVCGQARQARNRAVNVLNGKTAVTGTTNSVGLTCGSVAAYNDAKDGIAMSPTIGRENGAPRCFMWVS